LVGIWQQIVIILEKSRQSLMLICVGLGQWLAWIPDLFKWLLNLLKSIKASMKFFGWFNL
jgi:hypothetical protein